ncbi:hypothetical protein FB45DRAFT_946366 [Roridomyces roridus]|uniref:MYND-type domain-containing protein n=1 Tax=Roridomyces roridus TaxID=1738132 RepID=A0AAD7F8E0_9AGAR|nr:hypothetical protein FB45DRAFT_946366 [Roridomyces roridus]
MYLRPDYKLKAVQNEASYRVIRKEWAYIKDDPDALFALTDSSIGKRCSLNACGRPVPEPGKVCGGCKTIVYCSEACAKVSWWGHKAACAAGKRDSELVPKYKAVVEQFPWTKRAHSINGVFHFPYVLVQYGLLDMQRKNVGYWAQSVMDAEQMGSEEAIEAPWCVLSEEEGWRLPKEHIPSLKRLHEPNAVCPVFPPAFGESWASYYEWRGIPIDSIAALRLDCPLAVYACLKEMGFVSIPEERRKLTVFYLGARDEIMFIPVFGELALLFPNTDLDLVMYGPSVALSVQRNKSSSTRPRVFQYTSPTACGGGTIRVFLDSKSDYYRPSRNTSEHPDAFVALDAGLSCYNTWIPVVCLAAEFGIPFAATDYGEACVSQFRMDLIAQALTGTLPYTKNVVARAYHENLEDVLSKVHVGDIEKTSAVLHEAQNRPVRFNPFMQPATRQHGSSLFLGANNACIQVVVPGRKSTANQGDV